MGGDNAPEEPVRGAIAAASASLQVLLVGDRDALAAELDRQGGARENIEIVHAAEKIESHEEGARAVRAKPDSSVALACRLVGAGRAQAVMSAGHTGAMLAAATLYLRRAPGVLRPGIAVVLPTNQGEIVLIDAGANAEARPEHIEQFALMGRLFAHDVLGVAEPTVGLLSIGEEDGRGSDLVLEAGALLKGSPGFVGHVEGRDIPRGVVDVVVTDGFSGNVVLKAMEGTAAMLFHAVRDALRSSISGRIGGFLARPALLGLRERLNPDWYGGAYLLGVRGIAVIGHGNAGGAAIANGLRLAARGAREDLVGKLSAGVRAEETRTPSSA